MRYFIVQNEQVAKDLSSLIYSIMYPSEDNGGTQYLFGWDSYNDQTVIKIPENYICPIFLKDNFESTIEEISLLLGDVFSEKEGESLVEYLKTGSIILENIIPSGLVEVNGIDFNNTKIETNII